MEQTRTSEIYHFRNSIVWTSERRGILSADQHPKLEVGSPPEFRGTPDVWCPEDLLIGALNTCLMLTFLAVAKARKIEVAGYESEAEGTVERRDGKLRVTQIKVHPRVKLKSESDFHAAQEAMKRTKEVCVITNSILATVDLAPEIQGPANA